MPSVAQLQKIWLLSDTVLYREAGDFIRKLVQEHDCDPLPTSQINGLLSIAESASYDALYQFVVHQRDRNWPPSKRDIKTFYTELELVLSQMQRRRLKEEFHLTSAANGKSVNEIRAEEKALMALLAREFIQHLVAENGLLLVEAEDRRRRDRLQRQNRR
jgi:hypothetical protein